MKENNGPLTLTQSEMYSKKGSITHFVGIGIEESISSKHGSLKKPATKTKT